ARRIAVNIAKPPKRRASGLRNGARRVAFDNVAAGFNPPMCLLGRQAPAKLARSIQLPKEAGATAQKVIVMAVDNRHGDKRGEISQKHGNTLIRTLRQTYGAHFAKDCADDDKLTDVLPKLDNHPCVGQCTTTRPECSL